MAVFPLLAEPSRYRACDWDLKADVAGRRYWVDNFRTHVGVLLDALRTGDSTIREEQIERFAREYDERFADVDRLAATLPRVDILYLDEVRQAALDAYGFADPYLTIKARETAAALRLLPGLLAELGALSHEERIDRLAQGLLAGNIFDLGSTSAMERYAEARGDFLAARERLAPRPWFIDHSAAWARRWRNRPWRHVVMFVDNAGPDVCLGCLPLARELARSGSRVTLAANTRPALNDITAPELDEVLIEIGGFDPVIAEELKRGSLRVRATGGWAPLIDLTQLSDEFVAAVADADLVHIHGMGRSVESNWKARFRCDALWTAVLKDDAVSDRLGAAPFACIIRFESSND